MLYHGDAVHDIGGFHRFFVVRHDHELRLLTELLDHAVELVDVVVVERCVNLVEYAKRRRLVEEDREEEGRRSQRFFTA